MLANPRFAVLIITATNLLFIAARFLKRFSFEPIDWVYLIVAVFSLALILPSYWNNKYNKFVRFGFMLCIIRQSMYFFDFSDYRETYTFERWFFSC